MITELTAQTKLSKLQYLKISININTGAMDKLLGHDHKLDISHNSNILVVCKQTIIKPD